MKGFRNGILAALSAVCLSNSACAALLGEVAFQQSIGSNSVFSSASYFLKYTIFNPDLVIFDAAMTEGDDGKVFRFDATSADFAQVVAWLINGGAGTPIQHGLCNPGSCALVTTTDPFLNPDGFIALPGSGIDFVGHSIDHMEMAINTITFAPNTFGGTTVNITGSFRTYGDEVFATPEPGALLLAGLGLAGVLATSRSKRQPALPRQR